MVCENEKILKTDENEDNLTCLDCIYQVYHLLLGTYCSLKEIECKKVDSIFECFVQN